MNKVNLGYVTLFLFSIITVIGISLVFFESLELVYAQNESGVLNFGSGNETLNQLMENNLTDIVSEINFKTLTMFFGTS